MCAGVARCRLPHVSDCRESEGGWKKKICSGIRLDCGITMVSDKTRSNKLKRYKASDNREFNREFMDLVLFQSSNWLKSFERTQCASSIFFFFLRTFATFVGTEAGLSSAIKKERTSDYGGVRIEPLSWTGLLSGWSVVGYRSSTRINIRGIGNHLQRGR